MAAPPPPPATSALHVTRKREVNWLYATPMFLMALPLIRIAFRRQPELGRKLTYGAIAVGLVHGTWLIARSQPDDAIESLEKFHTPQTAVNNGRGASPPASAR